MGQRHHGRHQTDLEWGLEYVYDMISNKIMSERKTDVVGIVAVNSTGELESKKRVAMQYNSN